jgi:hypothetical protein
MIPFSEFKQNITRRHFFAQGSHLLGTASLASLLGGSLLQDQAAAADTSRTIAAPKTHFPPKAKHVIYLHMVGGPPQMDLYD